MLLSSLDKLTHVERKSIYALAVLTGLLFSMPFILCLKLNAGFLGLANESLAYRFFFAERVFAGETVTVGVGYLISILHQIIYGVMHLFPSVVNSSLEQRLDLFALITNGILSAFICLILLLATLSKHVRVIDLALLILVTLMPLYGTVMIGFDFMMMADYYSLNIALLIITLFIFQQIWLRNKFINRTSVIFLGIFVGLAMANKITMLVVTGVVLVPSVFASNIGVREILIRTMLAITCLISTFFAVHLAAYHGSLPKMLAAGSKWWAFVKHPGAEPDFLANFSNISIGYNYPYFLFFSIVVLALAIAIILSRKPISRNASFVTIYCLVAYLISIYFIIKRPAGTTLFESTLFLFTLACIQITIFAEWRFMRHSFMMIYFVWISFAATSFSYSSVYDRIAHSRADSEVKWVTFKKVLELAGNQPIEVIFPDNSFHHEGPFELLLKGACDFPTWNITYGQNSIIDRYAPGMVFRHDSGQVRPEMPYANSRVLVWFDLDGNQPLEEKYLELKKALMRPGVQRSAPPGYSHLKMHIALIP